MCLLAEAPVHAKFHAPSAACQAGLSLTVRGTPARVSSSMPSSRSAALAVMLSTWYFCGRERVKWVGVDAGWCVGLNLNCTRGSFGWN